MHHVTESSNTSRTLPSHYGWMNHVETNTVEHLESEAEETPKEQTEDDM